MKIDNKTFEIGKAFYENHIFNYNIEDKSDDQIGQMFIDNRNLLFDTNQKIAEGVKVIRDVFKSAKQNNWQIVISRPKQCDFSEQGWARGGIYVYPYEDIVFVNSYSIGMIHTGHIIGDSCWLKLKECFVSSSRKNLFILKGIQRIQRFRNIIVAGNRTTKLYMPQSEYYAFQVQE